MFALAVEGLYEEDAGPVADAPVEGCSVSSEKMARAPFQHDAIVME